ncbi:MAG: antibiotic biosynthesis monooxygenase [Chloroflexi bacterium]|nr:antibiotic biosynthesis monooxygenase [Chloroflexota bacterium]MBM3172952.1 antibiotic biosynthesis monooxygenase [Chloroflexota bacterium]MBM3174497.1 antibiotic biosynthesis monooxygenase [Chloroflexota bacterium]MBM4449553.1 antibiotic biosynthesis monooxygenase [Chloroflexota bacterium]
MLIVAATLKAAQGKGDELEKEFRKLIPEIHKEPGTLTYIVHRALDDADKFLVYERYENKEALDYHTSTPYFKEFFKAAGSLAEGRPEIGLYREIG